MRVCQGAAQCADVRAAGPRAFDRQRRLVGTNRLLQVVGPIAADAVPIGEREVVLCRGPLVRQGLARADRERCLKGANRLLQVVGPIAADAVHSAAEVVCVVAHSRGRASRVMTVSAAS